MAKSKPVLPSLRENKRYLAFEIISEEKLDQKKHVSASIDYAVRKCLGLFDTAKAGIMFLPETYKDNKGIIKVNNSYLDMLRASLCFIGQIDRKKVVVRSLGASGIIRKAKRYTEG